MAKKLMKGCEAIGEAAIQAGCRLFFGYPITPQNEIPEYMSGRLPQVGGMFVQAESEVAASNMLYGAAGAGCRCFTSSSSPGISLMVEGISYMAGAELPVVIVNIMRAGPGLGGILPSQSDYLQATKGGGHGDYRVLVLAPSTVQEAADLTMEAFDLADKYRNPVMILGDGLIGQMMEPVEFKRRIEPADLPEKPWATTGRAGPGAEHRQLALPQGGGPRAAQLAPRREVPRDGGGGAARDLPGRRRPRRAHRGLRHGGAHRAHVDRRAAREGPQGRAVPAGHAVPVSRPRRWRRRRMRAKHVLVAELSMGQMVEDVRAVVAGRRAGGVLRPRAAAW